MQFFMHEIVARVVAIYLVIEGSRTLWNGLAERKTSFVYNDLIDMFFKTPEWIAQRDIAPFRYWFLIGGQMFTLIACLVVAIYGWWTPNT